MAKDVKVGKRYAYILGGRVEIVTFVGLSRNALYGAIVEARGLRFAVDPDYLHELAEQPGEEPDAPLDPIFSMIAKVQAKVGREVMKALDAACPEWSATNTNITEVADKASAAIRKLAEQAKRAKGDGDTRFGSVVNAWIAVCGALTNADPHWLGNDSSPRDAAVAAIRTLAAKAKAADAARPASVPAEFLDAMGRHLSESCRDGKPGPCESEIYSVHEMAKGAANRANGKTPKDEALDVAAEIAARACFACSGEFPAKPAQAEAKASGVPPLPRIEIGKRYWFKDADSVIVGEAKGLWFQAGDPEWEVQLHVNNSYSPYEYASKIFPFKD